MDKEKLPNIPEDGFKQEKTVTNHDMAKSEREKLENTVEQSSAENKLEWHKVFRKQINFWSFMVCIISIVLVVMFLLMLGSHVYFVIDNPLKLEEPLGKLGNFASGIVFTLSTFYTSTLIQKKFQSS